MIAVVAPGQGSQSPGMLAPWLDLPGVHDRLAHWSDLVGLDLVHLGTEGTAEQVTETSVTQPLLAATILISAEQLGLLDRPAHPGELLVAGHSIGELPAAAIAGALTPDEAVSFAGHRGAAMGAACKLAPSAMAAVLGGDPDEVVAAIQAAGCVTANRNGGGQIVAAGGVDAIDKLVANPPPRARVRLLSVAGAFHSDFMATAEASLGEWAQGAMHAATPTRPLLSNVDGRTVADGNDLIRRLISQITRPVRWDLCMEAMTEHGVEAMIELAPGGTLTGLAKRALKGVELFPITSPSDLDSARAAIGAAA